MNRFTPPRICGLTLLSDKKQPNIAYKGGHDIVSLQILKAICAFFVVQIHVDSCIQSYLMPISRIAVPIFLMITGYFFLNKDGILSVDRIKKTFIKILKLAVTANLLYLGINILTVLFKHPEASVFVCHRVASFDVLCDYKFWIKTVLIGQNLCIALWYLNAVLQALAILYFCVRFNLYKLLPYIVILGLSLNFAIGEFHLLGPFETSVHRNFLTIAIPCIYIGMTIRLNEHRIKLSAEKLFWLSLGTIILLYAERAIFHYTHIAFTGKLMLMNLPVAATIFILALKKSFKNNWLAIIGKKYSLHIYIYHLLVYLCLSMFNLLISPIEALEVYIASIVFSMILIRLKIF